MNPRGCFRFLLIGIALVVMVIQFTGCTVSSPQTRAQKHPGLLEKLSPADQDRVLRRTITEGMSRDAVYLAWGKADSLMRGSENGKEVEVWRYATLQPVYNYGGFGWGMGLGYAQGYRGRAYAAPYATYQLGPDYLPVTSAIVRFRSGKVVSWEMLNSGPPR